MTYIKLSDREFVEVKLIEQTQKFDIKMIKEQISYLTSLLSEAEKLGINIK